MNPTRRKKKQLLLALGTLVVAGCIAAALFFGETSPVIASGRVTLSETLKQQAQGMRSLFIIVRDADSPMPMPWGALTVTLSDDPGTEVYDFILTRDNLRVMNPAAPEPKKLQLKARLDLNGLAGPDASGDIVGRLNSVPFGSKDLVIELNDLINEDSLMAEP